MGWRRRRSTGEEARERDTWSCASLREDYRVGGERKASRLRLSSTQEDLAVNDGAAVRRARSRLTAAPDARRRSPPPR